jgi:hypothetical protein
VLIPNDSIVTATLAVGHDAFPSFDCQRAQ